MTANVGIKDFGATAGFDFGYLHLSQKLRQAFAAVALTLACTIYAGYLFDIEKLYRLIPAGSATHELTAICTGLLAIAVFFDKLTHTSRTTQVLAGLASAIATLRVIEFSLGGHFLSGLTPFHQVADQALKQGISHSMGVNTAIALAAFGLSMLLRHARPLMAFAIGSIAPFILISSLVGYSYNAEKLHGAMSLNTAFAFLPLCLALLMLWAHHPFSRGIFAKNSIGYSARRQLLLAVLLPWLGGLLLMKIESNITIYTFALYTTALSWLSIGLILLGTIKLELKDRTRRCNERKLLELSTTDELTGCYNRRMAVEFGQVAVLQSMRSGHAMSVLMVDIDDFKNINDTYGHPIGDEVIRSIARVVKRSLRGADIVSRWGGEEFIVLLHDSNSDGAYQAAEKIRVEVENMHLHTDMRSLPKVTVSIGCATHQPGGDSFFNLVKCADDAMYFAKQNGKNSVVQYTETMKIPMIAEA